MSDEMAAILREKSGAERLQIGFDLFESARTLLTNMLAADHPDWTPSEVRREVSRRLLHEAR